MKQKENQVTNTTEKEAVELRTDKAIKAIRHVGKVSPHQLTDNDIAAIEETLVDEVRAMRDRLISDRKPDFKLGNGALLFQD